MLKCVWKYTVSFFPNKQCVASATHCLLVSSLYFSRNLKGFRLFIKNPFLEKHGMHIAIVIGRRKSIRHRAVFRQTGERSIASAGGVTESREPKKKGGEGTPWVLLGR